MSAVRAVEVLFVNHEDEIAGVVLPDGGHLGVNLWELKPYKRRFDGYWNWRFEQVPHE